MDELTLYASMYRIRRFEETVLEEFKRGVFSGTTHTYIGQEADAVGVIHSLAAQDVIVTNHRCHGHFLAYGGEMRALFAELMGKATGVCGGRGGSQHLHWRNLYSNGIQGGIVPIASGMAMAEKRAGSQAVVTVFIGDGTLGEGIVYESLNMASLWNLPLLIVVENNHIAQTTPTSTALAGSIQARFEAFGIMVSELDSSDVTAIQPLAANCIEGVRTMQHPQALILNTCRFGPHSKSDDTRPAEDLARMKVERNPLRISRARLDENRIADLERKIDAEVRQAFELALADPFPQTEGLA
ncbi:MAG: thiamine pyrophosphate-dependent dehydrogenase E1 component subunit alpha [Anaerolineaceae bacterium]|nr:thiamine pyrophosphate-dependent dehydrogenase E1 component subunit alpha [Anaerolineaceae bacterium]